MLICMYEGMHVPRYASMHACLHCTHLLAYANMTKKKKKGRDSRRN